ncbi:hypothetical protein GH714_001664 [Hevea brasiliensis]|uniref:Translation elongation factor EF1B beta/delta subunit guanine nucleotide exchange domain-containing protein n=1 Tax=Hevea brasiliensis TaxID=3981 RepID=A0A6A6KQ59_HEVBR|nr:hypothetical protein GH714_001664 [Hevea brasiliensis]
MAVTFSDLHTELGLKFLDGFCRKILYFWDKLSRDDIKVYAAVLAKTGDASPMPASGTTVYLHILRQGCADGDDDDLDLFGDETEEEKKAAEEREAAKKPAKKKERSFTSVCGKSSVLLDVKPWDETDMKKLEESVRSVEMPVCFSLQQYPKLMLPFGFVTAKLVPVGYGIKKLQIMLTIVDDLVSVDSLIEERLTVEPCSEYVQSCDIVAFNKI